MTGRTTRRDALRLAVWGAAGSAPSGRLAVPIHRVTDAVARYPRGALGSFWSNLWPEAYRNFASDGIDLVCTDAQGEVRHSPSDRPVFLGLRGGVINLVLTDHVPMHWDRGRSVAGISAIYDGLCISVIALRYANANQAPLLSVNTCVHELLHVLMQDVFKPRPTWSSKGGGEAHIDWLATRLWLFHDGRTIRESARRCLVRLNALGGARG